LCLFIVTQEEGGRNEYDKRVREKRETRGKRKGKRKGKKGEEKGKRKGKRKGGRGRKR